MLVGAVALAAVLLRRFGASYAATALAVGLFVVANGGVQSWYFLAMSEPVGLLLILGASLIATRYQNSPRPALDAILIGLLLSAAIAAKETFIATMPFVLFVMACKLPISAPIGIRVNRHWLKGAVVVACLTAVLNMIPLALVLADARSGSYGGRYSLTGLSTSQLLNAFYATTLPVTRAPHFPANIAYIGVLLAGFVVMWRDRSARRHLLAVIAGALLLLTGAAVYAPWPAYPGYYALAFLPGSCLVLGASLSAIEGSASKPGRAVAFCGIAGVLAIGSMLAGEQSARYRAARLVDYAVVSKVGEISARTLIVGVPDPAASGDLGRGILTYAHYLGTPSIAQAIDVNCMEASRRASVADVHTVVVRTSELCPAQPAIPDGARIAYRVNTLDWRRLARRQVEVIGEIWGGARAPSSSRNSMPAARVKPLRSQ